MNVDDIIKQVNAIYTKITEVHQQSLTLKGQVEELKLRIIEWENGQKEPHAWRKLMTKKPQPAESTPKTTEPVKYCKCGARCVRRNDQPFCLDCQE